MKTLEIEIFTLLLNLYIKKLITRTITRIRTIKATIDIKKMYKRIYKQTTDKRERTTISRSSSTDRTNTWTDQFTFEFQKTQ